MIKTKSNDGGICSVLKWMKNKSELQSVRNKAEAQIEFQKGDQS